jgi:hypothetical protein
MHGVNRDHQFMVAPLFAEGVCQSGESSIAHAHG